MKSTFHKTLWHDRLLEFLGGHGRVTLKLMRQFGKAPLSQQVANRLGRLDQCELRMHVSLVQNVGAVILREFRPTTNTMIVVPLVAWSLVDVETKRSAMQTLHVVEPVVAHRHRGSS